MRDEHTVICSPAVFELIAPDAPVVPVKVDLTYNSRDPYAVQASFRTGNGTAVDWVFARDLLHDGLIASAGTGDVRVQPMPIDPTRVRARAVLAVRARASSPPAPRPSASSCTAPTRPCPPATEYSWLDFDVALSDLLQRPRARLTQVRGPAAQPGGWLWTPAGPALRFSHQPQRRRCTCGRSAAGSASPCQGEGRGFESRRPLGGTSGPAGPPGPGSRGGPGVSRRSGRVA